MKRLAFLALPVMLGAALLLLTAPAARAEGDPLLQAAKAEFEEAQSLYTRELWDDAAAKFLSAYEKKPFSSFLFNAAVAYERAHKLEKALEMFQRYVDKDPQARDADEVKARIEGIKSLLAPPVATPSKGKTEKPAEVAVLPKIATKGLVIIESKPAGAKIYLDDKSTGIFAETPWQGSLEPKPVKLILEAQGFKSEEREISPRTDKVVEVFISMSEQHFLGWIEVISNVPGAEVFIDQREFGAIGRTPYTGHLKPGKHKLWVQKPGYEPGEKEVEVQPGTATTHNINIELVKYGVLRAGGAGSEGARLSVDGAFACALPCEKQIPAGDHRLVVEKEGMENYSGPLPLQRADQVALDLQFIPKPPKTKAWTEAVLSGLFLGGGVYLAVLGSRVHDDIKNDMAVASKMTGSDDSRRVKGALYYLGADVLLSASVVTGLLSAWHFLEEGPPSTARMRRNNMAEPEQKKVGFAPMALPGGAGMSAVGGF